MGQQPNIELEISDLPRPQRRPDPARSWIPDRPGELGGPEDMRFGTGFGTIGPDSGYAKSLVNSRSFDLVEGERAGNTKVALAAIASARAALFGRAPTAQDVDLAIVLLGLEPDLPETVRADLGAKRVGWFAAVAHHPAKLYDFVSSLDPEVLQLTAAEAQARMTQGTSLITH